MALIADAALDAALNVVKDGTTIHICSSEPATFAAISAASLGSRPVTYSANADRTGGGRQTTATPGTVANYTASGTASHYALASGTTLFATGALTANKAVNVGDAIDIDPVVVGLLDATQA